MAMIIQYSLAHRLLRWVIILALFRPLTLCSEERVKNALTVTFDYDWAISETEKQLTQSGSVPSKEALLYCALAYYKKGTLLQTAYEASLGLISLYYECRGTNSPLLAPSEFLPFAETELYVARGEYKAAASSIQRFRSGNPRWKMMKDVWSSCLGEKIGGFGKADQVDASNYAYSSERLMLRGLLGLPLSRNAHLSLTQDITSSRLARNRILISLSGLSRADKVKLLSSVRLGEPLFEKKSSEASTEVYYDILSLLSAARCSFSISKDLFSQLDGMLNSDDRPNEKYREVVCVIGELAFLLEDYKSSVERLKGDTNPRSSVYLGASYFKLNEHQKAEEAWRSIEQAADPSVLSWLGYIYARLGINLNRADSLSGRLIADREQSQRYAARYAAVLEKEGKDVLGVYNSFYDFEHRGVLHLRANEPEFTITYCAALQRLDPGQIAVVNELLYGVQKKYPYLLQLYEASTGLFACREVLSGRK